MTDKKRPEQKTVRDMNKFAITLLCCAALAACGGNTSDTGSGDNAARPIGGGGGLGPPPAPPEDEPPEEELPGEVAFRGGSYQNDVVSVAYNPATETLLIEGDPFDFVGDFDRSPADDVDGFVAFRSQTSVDPSEREYLAYLGIDADAGLEITVVGTQYRLRREFGGHEINRDAVPKLPTNEQLTHDGHYAAVRTLLFEKHRIEGQAQLFLDFFVDRPEPGIEGRIFERRNLDTGESMEDITLTFTTINPDGTFRGVAQPSRDGAVDEERRLRVDYEGMIAGDGAAASAGIVVVTDGGDPRIDGPADIERGAFIARRRD